MIKLRFPSAPFAVLMGLPVITVPITLALMILTAPRFWGGDGEGIRLEYLQRAFLPGVLNLLPLLWLASSKPEIRGAALVCGAIGGLRFVAPELVLMAYGQDPWEEFIVLGLLLGVFALSGILWLLSPLGYLFGRSVLLPRSDP